MRAEIWASIGLLGIFHDKGPISVVIGRLLMKRMRALRGMAVAIGGAVGVLVSGAPRSIGNCTRSEMENQVNEVVVGLAYEKES